MGKLVLFLCIGVFIVGCVAGYFFHGTLSPHVTLAGMRLGLSDPDLEGKTVVARVGDHTITREDLDLRWEKLLSPDVRGYYEGRGGKRAYLDEMVNETLLALETTARKLEPDPATREQLRIETLHSITKPLILQEIWEKAFPEPLLRKRYEERNADWHRPEEVRVRHILVTPKPWGDRDVKNEAGDDAKTPEEARKKAERLLKEAKDGEDFATLARRSSEDASAPMGGDLGWFGRGRMVKPFDNAAFALQPGEISGIVETEYGYHLLKMEDRRPERDVPFEEAKDELLQELDHANPGLAQQRFDAFLKELRSRYGVVVDESKLR